MKKAAILIPTINKPQVLDICLGALAKSKGRELFDIYVIDNGSLDNSQVIKKYKKITYIKLGKNYMISNSINKVFFKFHLEKKYKYSIILAHDVLVDKNAVYELIQCFDSNDEIAMTGPSYFHYKTNKVSSTALTIDPLTSKLVIYKTKKTGRINHFASCIPVRSSAFKEIGGLDGTLFPMVFEEPDVGERLLKKGYKIVNCPTSKIYHPIFIGKKALEEEVHKRRILASRERSYLFFRNRIIYMSLYAGFLRFIIFSILINPIITLTYLPILSKKYLGLAFWGIIDGTIFSIFRNRDYIVRRNKQILDI